MKVSVTARHFDLTPDLKEHAEGRLARLDRFTTRMISTAVVLTVEKYRHLAEVSVHTGHGDFMSKAESDDMYVSIDGAFDKIEKQVRRSARQNPRGRNGDSKEDVTMGETRISSERRSREMMSLEEATSRVEEGEEIVVFADTDTGATRVVYRRPNGTVKLIEVAG